MPGLMERFAPVLAVTALVVGCAKDGNSEGSGDGGTTLSTTSTSSSDGGSMSVGSTTSSSGSADSTTGMPTGECTLWKVDDCGSGQKCMPWSLNPDDHIPDELRCCPAIDNPDLEGEPCTITDYDGSCLDSCEPGTFCVLDDIDTLGGHCRRFCDPGAPDCPSDQTCKSFFELLEDVPNVPLCMDQCDPLVQDCELPGWRCIPDSPTIAGQSGFICVSPPTGDPKGVLEACALANQCEIGLVCVSGSRLPNCTFTSCCTAFCDLGEGDASCQAIQADLKCVDWMSPDPQWQNVGACAIPG